MLFYVIRTDSYFKTGKIELDLEVFYESFESFQLSPFLTHVVKGHKLEEGCFRTQNVFQKNFIFEWKSTVHNIFK